MKGLKHKFLGGIIFFSFYYFKLFPAIINDFMNNYFALGLGFFVAIIFSGGRVKSKSFIHFGLSPDNDFHKKKQRSMILHSTLLPVLAVIFFKNPLIYLSAFFYSMHILIDLLNPLSFEGKRYSYFLIFCSTILFFVMIYQ